MSQPMDEETLRWKNRSIVDLDLSGVDEKSNNPVPAGTYRCKVVKFDPNQVSKADFQKVSIWFSIIEPEQYSGRYIFDQYTLQPKVFPYFKATLRGIFGVERLDGINLEWAAENAIDREVTVRVTVKKSDDYGESNQVAAVGSLGTPLEIPGTGAPVGAGAGQSSRPAPRAASAPQQGAPQFFKH